jgi:hypothetical protein
VAELSWCAFCGSQHEQARDCPGPLEATDTERHGWRTNVETPQGIEAYGVLVAESDELWRARILTFPNVLWLAPSGNNAMKFVGATAREAEGKAIDFIIAHCRTRGLRLCTENAAGWAANLKAVEIDNSIQRIKGPQSNRKIAFTSIRFGRFRPQMQAGIGNVSETGLFIITDTPVQSGNLIRMRLELETYAIPLKGEVCWVRSRLEQGRSPGMGIKLEQPPSIFAQYVRSLP